MRSSIPARAATFCASGRDAQLCRICVRIAPVASSTILIDFAADMDAAEALAFARKNPHAVLATMKRDGTLLSPVLVGVDLKDRLVSVPANPQ